MRKITIRQILVFSSLCAVALILAVGTAMQTLGRAPLGDFRGITLVAATVFLLYVYAVLIYRLYMKCFTLKAGAIDEGGRQEFIYHVYVLFYIILFYPVIRSGWVPAPLMRVFYLALGTRLGPNTYSQGIILDPPFVEIGRDSVIGQGALLVPHVIEGTNLAHYPIRIGDNVTIGAHAVVLCDVTIGDGTIVAAGAVVTKGTRIGPREVWGGVPARLLRRQ